MSQRVVTVLCSGFGLGFYIPGVLISNEFKRRGIDSEVLVFESYLVKEKMEDIPETRQAYHANFSLANVSARMPMDIRKSIDDTQVEQLLNQWADEDRREFISLSGHWVYIVELYRERMKPKRIHMDLLYVDSDLAPSWKSLKKYYPSYNEHYHDACLYNTDPMEIQYEIPVSHQRPLSFQERDQRLVVHGGGWGMGTYQSKIPELSEQGYGLDIIAYALQEAKPNEKHRFYMNDPAWFAWIRNEDGLHAFPPYYEMTVEGTKWYDQKPDNHWLFDLASHAVAIVAKPGAGTLIDSLATANPIIMLEPFGSHERSNAQLWEKLGYGMTYESWKETGFSMKALENMHLAILNRKGKQVSYVDHYCRRAELDSILK